MLKEALRVSVEDLVAEFVEGNPRSREMFERAKKSLPGGNTRTGVYVDPLSHLYRARRGTLFDRSGRA